MKTFLLILLFFSTLPLQAACKCSCDMTDTSICASGYDLHNPCPGICPHKASPLVQSRMACKPVVITNPHTGAKMWAPQCPD